MYKSYEIEKRFEASLRIKEITCILGNFFHRRNSQTCWKTDVDPRWSACPIFNNIIDLQLILPWSFCFQILKKSRWTINSWKKKKRKKEKKRKRECAKKKRSLMKRIIIFNCPESLSKSLNILIEIEQFQQHIHLSIFNILDPSMS